MNNKNLILFIGIGFIVTVIIWGFVGGCGTTKIHHKAIPAEGFDESEGLILEDADLDGEGAVYIVEAGDTLWEISREYGVTISVIKEVNKLTADTITVGQRLVIPISPPSEAWEKEEPVRELRPASVKADLVVYKVRKGDSLWRIAQIHGTTIERITELNGIPKNMRLKPGQELLVPKDAD